jgi:TetR/AcrR family transcriptional regulator, cholesterol catabolism regulator
MAKIATGETASRKEAIQKTAALLFRQKGYTATSMRHLAEGIGIEAASLYNHISSKEELLRGICFEVADAFITHMDSVENSSLTPTAQLEELIRFHIRMRLDHFDEVVVNNSEWQHLKEPYQAQFVQLRRNYQKRWEAIIEKGIEQKLLKPLNPYIIVLTILAAVRGVEYWHRSKRSISAETVEHDIVAMLNSAIQLDKKDP